MRNINREILQIAVPSIVSNITVPLLGLIDVAIMGHLGSPAYIGAIAVGGMIFNTLYWVLGFLRMGTSGMTSQAYGKGDRPEIIHLLVRALLIGTVIGVIFVLFQVPICRLALAVMQPTSDVASLAAVYFNICIWGAPATLALYGLTGWFIGMQNTRIPMIVAITQNVVNIVASLSFVYFLGMKVEGVAAGTLIAQYAGLVTAVILWRANYRPYAGDIDRKRLWTADKMKRFFQVNRDIFFRTLCIIAVTLYFTSQGAVQGEVILAVNTLLMQFFTLFSYVMDGFAYAGEAMSGRYIGAEDCANFRIMKRRLFLWGTATALVFTLIYTAGGDGFLSLLTDDASVMLASHAYIYWARAIPLIGMGAFIWDGIFIGATATKEMLISMFISMLLFFGVYFPLAPLWGNHALWLAFLVYLASRGGVQTLLAHRVELRAFGGK